MRISCISVNAAFHVMSSFLRTQKQGDLRKSFKFMKLISSPLLPSLNYCLIFPPFLGLSAQFIYKEEKEASFFLF